jgi:hypothetical protein
VAINVRDTQGNSVLPTYYGINNCVYFTEKIGSSARRKKGYKNPCHLSKKEKIINAKKGIGMVMLQREKNDLRWSSVVVSRHRASGCGLARRFPR